MKFPCWDVEEVEVEEVEVAEVIAVEVVTCCLLSDSPETCCLPSDPPETRSLNIGDPISVLIVKRDDIDGYFTASSYGGGSSTSCPDSNPTPFRLVLDCWM